MLGAMSGSGTGSGVGTSSLRRQSTRNMSTRGFITEDEYSSAVEKFLATVYAPELTTFQGRITVIAIWLCACVVAFHGCMNIEVNFKFEYFIPPGSIPDLYFTLDRKYFNGGNAGTVYIENDDPIIDYSLPENQYALLDFHDKLQRCYLCDKAWIEKDTLRNWYTGFRNWVRRGECFLKRGGPDPFEKIVDPEIFYVCLQEYLVGDDGDS